LFSQQIQPLATVGLDPSGAATYATSSLSLGSHFIVAYYAGDANFLSSSTAVVQTVVGPAYHLTASPAALTVKLGQMATSTVTITPVGGFKGQVSLACGGAPQIATCSITPLTVVLPGDDVPKSVQFTLTTTVVAAAMGSSAQFGESYAAAIALFSPLGFFALASAARRRNRESRIHHWRGARRIALGLLLLGLTGCGGGHTTPYGKWTIVMTATPAGGGPPNYGNISVTITP